MSIRFPCPKCQRSLKVPDELAGKRAKCPHCTATVDVPGGASHAVANKAVAHKAAAVATPKRPPSAEFIGLDKPIAGPGAGKPYRRNRGNPVLKLMILVLFLFLVVGGGIAAVKLKLVDSSSLLAKVGIKGASTEEKKSTETGTQGTNKDTPPTKPVSTNPKDIPPAAPLTDSHFLPDNTVAVVHLNFESLLNSKLYDKVKEELAKEDKSIDKLVDPQVKPLVGVQFAAIGRVVVGSAGADDSVLIVRPRNPVTIEQVKPNKEGEYKEVKVGRFTLYEGSKDAYCLVDEGRILVISSPALLKKVLERDKPVELKAELETAYKAFAPTKTVSVAFVPADAQKAVPGGPGFKPPSEFEPAVQAKAGLFQLDLAQGLEISATFTCKDAAAAEALKKAIEDTITKVKKDIDDLKKDKEGTPEEKQLNKAAEILGQIKVAVEGPTLSATLALNNETTIEVFEAAKQFLMAMRAGQ